MEKIYFQQGDVIGVEVDSIPKTAKRIEAKGRFIVEKGEGVNTHELLNAEKFEIYQEGDTLYLKALEQDALWHTEHGTQVITPGKIIRRRIEREWDYEAEEARKTLD